MQTNNSTNQLLGAGGGSEDNTEEILINFIDRLDLVRKDAEYPGSDLWNYSQDSMIWYIEAALNYKYAFPNHERSKLILDSMFINIDVPNEGSYNISELLKAFDNSYSTIKEKFGNIKAEHKLLVSVDYSIKSRENNELTLVAYIYFGKFGVYLPRGDWRIFNGDYGQGGICGTSTYLNYDATDRIEQEEFSANPVHQLNVCFTDYEDDANAVNYIGMSATASNFNYTPYTIYWFYHEGLVNISQNPNYPWSSCLTVYYMDQYELNAKELSSKLVTYKGKSLIVFDLFSGFYHTWIQGEEWMSQGMGAWTITFANSHPRIYDQTNDFIQ